jgi:hypothetical protein
VTDADEARDHLRTHGWEIEIEIGDGWTWAALVAAANPDVVMRRYGRGEDEPAAVVRAWRRYRLEQLGGDGPR